MAQTDIIQEFKKLDTSSSLFPDQLTSLLYKKEYKDCIPNLPDEDVVWLVNYLDDVLETLQTNPSSAAFRRCLRELGRVCGTRQRLPQSYILESSLSNLGRYPVASGGSGDVYEGSLNGSKVCVKRLRIYAREDSPGSKKTFHREAVMWRRLTHQNIVPLFGITLKPLQLISAWMSGGEIKEYITHHPSANRLKLLFGVAEGLNYLHCRNIVHGDLKGPNILVDDAGCPRITDFGLAMVAQNQDSVRSAQGDHGHTARWTAPEILNGQGTYSKEADVFSFAMVMVEVFTGQVPFHPNLPPAAMLAILDQKRPARPTHPQCTAGLWKSMKTCWGHDPLSRPEISTVLKAFRSSPSFSNDWASDVSTSYSLLDSADSETSESLESPLSDKGHEQIPGTDKPRPTGDGETPGPDQGGSVHGPDDAQTSTQNATPDESTSRHSEVQGGKSTILTDLSPPRRGTDQSEQTPLPVDPPQFNSDQPHNLAYGYPRADGPHSNLPPSRRSSDAPKEYRSGPRADGNNSRSGSHNDSVGETAATREPPLQGNNHGVSEPHLAGDNHDNKSQNSSLHDSGNHHPGNSSQSRAVLLQKRSNLGASRNELQPEINPPQKPQAESSPRPAPTTKGSPHSISRDRKPNDSPDHAEPNGASHTSGASRGHARTDSGRNTSEKEHSWRSSDVALPNPEKDRGIWYQIKRFLGCVSDENVSS